LLLLRAGLTSRPELSRSSSTSSGGSSTSSSNPYTITAQAHLTMRLCAALGLEQVVLVGHADGALVALVAASLAGHHPGSNFSFQQQLHMSQQSQQEQQRWGSSYPEELTPKFLMAKISNMLGRPNSGDFSGLGVPLNDGTSSMRNSQMYTFGSSGSLPQLAQQQQQQQQAGQEDVEAAGEMSSPGPLSSMTSSVSMQSLASMGANSTGAHTGAHAGLADASQQAQELEPAAPQPAVQQQQQQQQGYGLQQQRHAAAVSSAPGPPSARHSQAGMPPQGEWMSRSGKLPSVVHASTSYLHTQPGCSMRVQRPARQQYPLVTSLVLLHPNMSGQLGPTFTRLLAKSKLGKAIMRPLLRTEIGEVSNRRAWHNTDKLTAEVLQLYKVPLRVHGWDAALVEITRCKKEYSSAEIRVLCEMVCALPGLVVTGDHDKVVPPSKAEEVAQSLRHAEVAVVHNCGHLSHEEAPQTLLEVLVPFLGQVLQPVLLPLSAAHSMPQLQEQVQQQAWGEQGM
jgi:pimeloyl-ACP methyl ester carboxylesterase